MNEGQISASPAEVGATAGVKWHKIGQVENAAIAGGQGLFPGRWAAKKTRYQRDAEEDAWKGTASSYRPSTCIFGTALTVGRVSAFSLYNGEAAQGHEGSVLLIYGVIVASNDPAEYYLGQGEVPEGAQVLGERIELAMRHSRWGIQEDELGHAMTIASTQRVPGTEFRTVTTLATLVIEATKALRGEVSAERFPVQCLTEDTGDGAEEGEQRPDLLEPETKHVMLTALAALIEPHPRERPSVAVTHPQLPSALRTGGWGQSADNGRDAAHPANRAHDSPEPAHRNRRFPRRVHRSVRRAPETCRRGEHAADEGGEKADANRGGAHRRADAESPPD